MERTSARRWISMVLVGVLLSALAAGVVVYRQSKKAQIRVADLMTLHEALWVTERDWSRFYSPGSSESRSVAQALISADPSLAERKYEGFILYRRGLSDTVAASEPLLVFGFDPKTIPANGSGQVR